MQIGLRRLPSAAGEGIAGIHLAGGKSTVEPAHTLFRGAVSEGVGGHVPPPHPLQTVISNGGWSLKAGLDVRLIGDFSVGRRVGPYAGEAIRLQLHGYG